MFFCSAIGQQRLKTVQKTIVCSQEKKENWSTDNRGILSLIPRPDRRRPDRRSLETRLRCQALSLVPSSLGYEATKPSHVTEMNTRLSNVYKL